ncbi:unnamed protein product [Rangifer tarandus platyrhynchus]|uniref:Uncharacterized protein n=3 Tax=Rangifer tarandus platyrhynchus TaxID=3082113 RepID=A0ACB0EF41_RANTA|nr:unnamed protein product [Rangifer tarandus platyrhynchus]CAI9699270.1 unnamed protein product [Rangifer tarandus platyrhynchus]
MQRRTACPDSGQCLGSNLAAFLTEFVDSHGGGSPAGPRGAGWSDQNWNVSDLWMPPASATGGHHPTAWNAAHGEQQWRLEAALSFLTTSLRCSDCKSCEKLLT